MIQIYRETSTSATIVDSAEYYNQRLKEIGLTANDLQIEVTIDNPDGTTRRQAIKLLDYDKDTGDIIINFVDLYSNLVQYDNDKVKTGKNTLPYQKIRYKEPKITKQGKSIKYKNPSGVPNRPFFLPSTILKFQNKERIDTLIIVEGEFKALAVDKFGCDIVAIGGIHNFSENDKSLHSELSELLKVCEVRTVILLHDGDAHEIKEKHLDSNAAKRPYSFISAVKNYREAHRADHPRTDIIYTQVNSTCHPSNPKGIDNLLLAFIENRDRIIKDLQNVNTRKKSSYFHYCNVTNDIRKLSHLFSLNNETAFYERHKDLIGNKRFVFRGTSFQFNTEVGELTIVMPQELENFVRIGDTYFEEWDAPRPDGSKYTKRDKRNKGTITDDYGRDFLLAIRRCKGWANIPNYENYSRFIDNAYNLQHPLPYEPYEERVSLEDIPNFVSLVKHIFGEDTKNYKDKSIPSFELGLDYVQLLLFNRMLGGRKIIQQLPILVLVSKENATGKGTFAQKFLRLLLGKNAVTIGNDDIQNPFNAFYAAARAIFVDEAMIEKRETTEKLKRLSTSPTIVVNDKGVSLDEIDFVGCFILASNNENRALYLTREDRRYWIRKVNKLAKQDPYFDHKLEQEIPKIFTFLKNRSLFLMQQNIKLSRMYFPFDLLKTNAYKNMLRYSEPKEVDKIRSYISELFDYCDPSVNEIQITYGNLNKLLFKDNMTYKRMKELLTEYLEVKPSDKKQRHKTPVLENQYDSNLGSTELKVIFKSFNGTPFIFKREDFVTQE